VWDCASKAAVREVRVLIWLNALHHVIVDVHDRGKELLCFVWGTVSLEYAVTTH
jgi:hypothetical protein